MYATVTSCFLATNFLIINATLNVVLLVQQYCTRLVYRRLSCKLGIHLFCSVASRDWSNTSRSTHCRRGLNHRTDFACSYHISLNSSHPSSWYSHIPSRCRSWSSESRCAARWSWSWVTHTLGEIFSGCRVGRNPRGGGIVFIFINIDDFL